MGCIRAVRDWDHNRIAPGHVQTVAYIAAMPL